VKYQNHVLYCSVQLAYKLYQFSHSHTRIYTVTILQRILASCVNRRPLFLFIPTRLHSLLIPFHFFANFIYILVLQLIVQNSKHNKTCYYLDLHLHTIIPCTLPTHLSSIIHSTIVSILLLSTINIIIIIMLYCITVLYHFISYFIVLIYSAFSRKSE